MKTALLVPLLLFVFSYCYSQSSIEISELSVKEYLTSEKPEVKDAQSYFITSNGKSLHAGSFSYTAFLLKLNMSYSFSLNIGAFLGNNPTP